MSTVIRSCPGCKSLILSDTDQCPECGHVFYERHKTESSGVAPATPDAIKSATMHEPCPHCGEMVRAGLVRCWSCNGFMRADVAARYRDLTRNPQPIIYSTSTPENRNEFLPPRVETAESATTNSSDNDGFQLGSGVGSTGASDFEMGSPPVPAPAPKAKAKSLKPASPSKSAPAPVPVADGPDKPQSTTQIKTKPEAGVAATTKSRAEAATAESTPIVPQKPASGSVTSSKSKNDDDLFSFAVEEQKEGKKRRGQQKADRLRKQVLVSCSCGAWIRVNEDQAGKSVRCKQCKQAVVVPGLRKKSEKTGKPAETKEKSAAFDVSWIDDVWYHVLAPASLVLKPGSLTGKHIDVDVALSTSGIQILTFSGTKKKRSLFSFGSSGKKADHQARRKQIHEQVAAAANFTNLENVELRTVQSDHISEIRLVQPVAKVSESMFAGVPVFGEGRIAIFMPIELEDGKQAFLSFSISGWRVFAERLRTLFSLELPGTESGIPDSDKAETLSCFLNQAKIESIKGLIYYQKDAAFQLQLTGYKCKACGTSISEEGRKKAKLGGAKGRGIAKAKCPKCANKMQAESLYKIAKGPLGATSDAG